MRIFWLTIIICYSVFISAMQKDYPESIRLNELLDSGAISIQQGNYTKALQQFNTCIQLSDKSKENHMREKVVAYLNIGNIHSIFFDFERAYTYYLKGYNMSRVLNDPEIESQFLNNMTGICCFMKKDEIAVKYNQMAKRLPLTDKNKQEYTYILNSGYIAFSVDEYELALTNFRESIRLAEKYKLESKYIAAPYSEISLIYEKTNRLDSTIFYLKIYNEIAESNKLAYMVVDSYKNLMKAYTKKGDKDAVLHYQELYFHLSDSLMNLRDFYKIKGEQQAYETTQNDQKIENLNVKLSAWQKTVMFIVVVLLIFTVFIYFIYKQKKKLQDAYQYLFDTNKDLVRIEQQYRNLLNAKKNTNIETNTTTAEVNGRPLDNIDAEIINRILNDINEIMESTDEFCNSEFSLHMLAKMVNSNTKYVSQIINDTYDKNFRTFINEYRIKEARKRLMEEKYANYTIQSIAESVGYKSSTNFIIAFKKATGITPSLYQKMAKTDKRRSADIK